MRILIFICIAFSSISAACLATDPGFNFLSGRHTAVIQFETFKNLIVVPVIINDTVKVNLILDTGALSIALFGERFKNTMAKITHSNWSIRGYGTDVPDKGEISHPNTVDLNNLHGEGVAICVIPNRKLIPSNPKIDGWIGYDIFMRYFVEINYKDKTVKFSDGLDGAYASGFETIPMDNHNSKPYIFSNIQVTKKKIKPLKLLIDTGSCLGLALFCPVEEEFSQIGTERNIAVGISGNLSGFEYFCRAVLVGRTRISKPRAFLFSHEAKETYGSLGADFLRDYIIIFDHTSRRLFLKQNI